MVKRYFNIVLLTTMLIVLYYVIVIQPAQYSNLLVHGRYTIATITAVSPGKNGASYPHYTFSYQHKYYYGYGNSTVQKQNAFFFRSNFTGLRFYVIFLPDNPSQHSILPYCMPPDSLTAPAQGWASLPTGKLTMVVGTTGQ